MNVLIKTHQPAWEHMNLDPTPLHQPTGQGGGGDAVAEGKGTMVLPAKTQPGSP